MAYCGLDFGTTNSTFSHLKDGKVQLAALENGSYTLPTAVFYNFDEDETFFGREAISEYVDGEFGRLLRSLKSVLGTPLMHDTTQVKTKHIPFLDIITSFLVEMKARAEACSGESFDQVVMGRPVYFVDEDKVADQSAEDALKGAALKAGFKDILFQYEPVAAALDYEQTVAKEELVLIVDLGGGTSDFSVVRVSPKNREKENRFDDILSNDGVHIGGTDFDKSLSIHSVMPHLGYRSPYKDNPEQEMPVVLHHNLATWHKIHTLYDKDKMLDIKSLATRMERRDLVNRFVKTVENKEGHRLAIGVENTKIALTDTDAYNLNLDYIEPAFALDITKSDFESAIDEEVARVVLKAKETVEQAGVQLPSISKLFMTGGSTSIPKVREGIIALFPHAEVVNGDKFGSVGVGLGVDAKRRFS